MRWTVVIMAVVIGALAWVGVVSLTRTTTDPKAGTMGFFGDKGPRVADAAREMVHAHGWRLEGETGDIDHVTIRATDRKGKEVTFDVTYGFARGKAKATIPEGAELKTKQVLDEWAKSVDELAKAPASPAKK